MVLRVGIVGIGSVAETYIPNLRRFEGVELVACAGRDVRTIGQRAARYGLEALTIEAMLARPGIDVILNLTPASAHAEVLRAAISAGKHVYSEKPLATHLRDSVTVVDLAAAYGVRLGAAPDVTLGAPLRQARRLIDRGAIGQPTLAIASALSKGMESWHPSPEQFFGADGGPARDLGPYYLSALNYLIGPVLNVSARGKKGRSVRQSRVSGKDFQVQTPSTISVQMELDGGVLAQLVTSWDVHDSVLPAIEIHGTEGTLRLRTPDWYGGAIEELHSNREPILHAVGDGLLPPAIPPNKFQSLRGIGVAEMATAIQAGRPHFLSPEWALHISATIEAIYEAIGSGLSVPVERTMSRPITEPHGLPAGGRNDESTVTQSSVTPSVRRGLFAK